MYSICILKQIFGVFEADVYFLISSSHVQWGSWNGKMNRITRSLRYSSTEYNCITIDLVLLMICLFLNVIHRCNCFGCICQIYDIYPHPGILLSADPTDSLTALQHRITLSFVPSRGYCSCGNRDSLF